ncbi:hypothetical protein [Streptomyces tsukubensis]|uniref:Uncharacterized protein n=1 Tax=Streptomyces tsukubensis TaxID=83656 RepID=A0A1V4AE01_9ACTN|nr:hypothetical protein [Streptomyces tsukubensis]OON81726.1 hypothetical protein B1H18_06190 [Streptomyces tsukubensis]
MAEAGVHVPAIHRADRDRPEGRLLGLAAARPRAEYVIVHGEAGPDRARVDAGGSPVVIDIEGCSTRLC